MKKDWTEELKHKMESHQMPAPDMLWDSLEKAMPEVAQPNVARRGAVLWIRKAAVAAAVVAAVTAGVIYLRGVKPSLNIEQEIAGNNSEKVSGGKVEADELSTVAKESLAEERLMHSHSPVIHSTSKEKLNGEQEYLSQVEIPIHLEANKENEVVQQRSSDTTTEANAHREIRETPRDGSQESYQAYAIGNERKSSGWSASVFASNVSVSTSGGNDAGGALLMSDYILPSSPPLFKAPQPVVKWHHKLPVDVGVKFRHNISDRFFAEVGVAYSYLESDHESNQIMHEQRLHYIGVPLGIGCTLWHGKRLSAYVVGAGKVQKLVSGEQVSIHNFDSPIREVEAVKERELQWSASAALGVEYKIIKSLGVYVEPGIIYHFNNGSKVDNIYKDKQTNFNLQLGLRLNY